MPKFPILRSTSDVPRVGPDVQRRLDVDVRTGAVEAGQAMAETGRAISGMGRYVGEIAGKIVDAEKTVELSTLQRKDKELWNAVSLSFPEIQEPKAREIAYKKYMDETSAGGTSEYEEVNRAYQVYLNNTLPRRQAYFNDIDRRMRINRMQDEIKINDQQDYEDIDKTNFVKRQIQAEKMGIQGSELTKKKIEEFDVESIFARVLMMSDSSPDLAITMLEGLTNLTSEQAIRKDNLIAHANGIKNRKDNDNKELQDKQLLDIYGKAYVKNDPITWDEVKATTLPAATKTRFWTDYKIVQAQKKRATDKAIKEEAKFAEKLKADKALRGLYKKGYLKGETLIFDDFATAAVSAKDQINLWRDYQNIQIAKRNAGISELAKGEVFVNAQITSAVDIDYDKLTPEDIWSFVPRGLGTEVAPRLVDRLKKNQSYADPLTLKYRSELARMVQKGALGNPKAYKTSMRFMRLRRSLDAFMKTGPSEAAADHFFKILMKGNVSAGHSWGANEMPGFEETPETISIGGREMELRFGDIIRFPDGQWKVATGKKDGKVEWVDIEQRASQLEIDAARARQAAKRTKTETKIPVIAEIPFVETDADFKALPSGTEYKGPDGKKRIKP